MGEMRGKFQSDADGGPDQYESFEEHARLAQPSRAELIRLYSQYAKLTEHLHAFAESEFKEYSLFLEKEESGGDGMGMEGLLLLPFLPVLTPLFVLAGGAYVLDKTVDAGRDLIDMPQYYAERDKVRKALKSGDIEFLFPTELIKDLRRALIEYSRTEGELIALVENGTAVPPPRSRPCPDTWRSILKAEKQFLKSPDDIQAMDFSALTTYAGYVHTQGKDIEYGHARPGYHGFHHDY
jgi:AAA+ ATPase superfamily predicted ATPase